MEHRVFLEVPYLIPLLYVIRSIFIEIIDPTRTNMAKLFFNDIKISFRRTVFALPVQFTRVHGWDFGSGPAMTKGRARNDEGSGPAMTKGRARNDEGSGPAMTPSVIPGLIRDLSKMCKKLVFAHLGVNFYIKMCVLVVFAHSFIRLYR